MSTERVYGIDLGTTYSCIAYVDDAGRPVVIPNSEGDNTTPSVVYFEAADNIIVGKEAKNISRLYPDQVAAFVKQQVGKGDYRFDVHGQSYTAEQVSALVLKKVVQDAEQTVGAITDVVITVPAYFGIAEREATKQAGKIAGLNVRDIIPEPTAAAICYGVQQKQNQTVLVYDLGGGTFDVTVIRIAGGHIEVVCTNGNHALGGKDWDARVTQFLAGEFQKQQPGAGDPMDDATSLQELALSAEDAKRALTAKEKDARSISHAGKRARGEITRAQFEEITSDLFEQTIALTQTVLHDAAKKGVTGIDKVLLVGGSSRMPYVKRRLQEVTGVEPEMFEPDQSVAKGAALYGMSVQIQAMLEGMFGDRPIETVPTSEREAAEAEVAVTIGVPVATVSSRPTMTNVSPKGYGIVALDPATQRQQVAYVLPSQSKLPAEHTETFYTVADNQTRLNIQVMEQAGGAESPSLEDNREITKGMVTGIPPGMPRHSPFQVMFRLETDGTLQVRAWEPKSGRELKLQAKITGLMSVAEVTMAENALALAKIS